MSLRRTVVAFAIAFVCALAVFTLPRFVWNTLHGAVRPQQPTAADSAARSPTPPAPSPQAAPRSIPQRLTGTFGIVLILGIGIALSRNRRAISWRVVAWGVGLQLAFAVFVLRVPIGQTLFRGLGRVVTKVLSFSYVGSEFVFGEIGKQHSSLGVIFAFQVLPAIIFVSALFAILYYLGVMQLVVKAFAIVMNKVMGASGAESLNVAASIFMGQTEAPLTIRPFLPGMTQSELMTVMTAGMAHVSGS
ncbi:MAG TPA: Na+ dependent nucleoside transporter N-terminal domain-containing protein, partial [Gemmatimonadales bacterium]|nr:Na+ dependent nucleoside transporter N-terminal domain-containing protein [Gemmatimonadales bacterium]